MKNEMVSFIIPTHNSEKTVEKCINSVVEQKAIKEVIVVDDGSVDGTERILRSFGGRIKYIKKGRGGAASARNAGLEKASGSYVAFVDSDVVLPANWTEKALALLRAKHVAAVGGPGVSPEKTAVSESLNSLLYGIGNNIKSRHVDSLATMNAIYKRLAIGDERFDEEFEGAAGEDPEFNLRMRKKGYSLVFHRDLKVLHDHPTTFRGLLGKWYRYGKNYPLLCSKHRCFRDRKYYASVLFMPLFILFLLLSSVSVYFVSVPVLQVLVLYALYVRRGLEISDRPNILVFSFIHTMKQLAQLFGTMVGLRKVL